jgi:hypothetical protein
VVAAQALAYAHNPSAAAALACGASGRDGHRDRPDSDVAASRAGMAWAVDALLGAAGIAPAVVVAVATAGGSHPSLQLEVLVAGAGAEAVVAETAAAVVAVVQHDGSAD